MNIEDEIFRRYTPDFTKVTEYGFFKKSEKYCLEKFFMNGDFKVFVTISKNGMVSGVVYDTENNDEYLPLRLEYQEGAFVGEVREAFENILVEIREKCFNVNYFVTKQANRIAEKIRDKYGDIPVFMWEKFPTDGVFKNRKNGKWYGIIMFVERAKIGELRDDKVEIINLKLDKNKIPNLCKKNGIYPAWHMNKKYWVSITLDETISDEELMEYIEESYSYTISKSLK